MDKKILPETHFRVLKNIDKAAWVTLKSCTCSWKPVASGFKKYTCQIKMVVK